MYELEKGDRLYTQVVGDTGAKLFIIEDLETGNVFRVISSTNLLSNKINQEHSVYLGLISSTSLSSKNCDVKI